jgi:hypothetical protein
MLWPCVNFHARYIRGAGVFLSVDLWGSCTALHRFPGLLPDDFFAMDIFLQQLAGYVTAEEQMEPHSSVAPSVSRFVRYRKSHLSFSLTQAGVIGPMRVIACSNATANMTFITAGWAATLYPEFTLCGKNIHRGHTQQIRGGENRIGSSKSDALALETDTSFLRAMWSLLSLALAFNRNLRTLWGFQLGRALQCDVDLREL